MRHRRARARADQPGRQFARRDAVGRRVHRRRAQRDRGRGERPGAPATTSSSRCPTPGGGIAPQIRSTASSNRSSRPRGSGKGTGLGLSQVYGFCTTGRRHRAHPRDVGRRDDGADAAAGAPRRRCRHAASRTPSRAPAPEHRELLLVEDNDELGQATETLLDAVRLSRSTRASSAEDAIELLDAGDVQFDVVLSDVVMPGGMNGVSFAQYLQQEPAGDADHPDHRLRLAPARQARLRDPAASRARRMCCSPRCGARPGSRPRPDDQVACAQAPARRPSHSRSA